MFYDLLNVVIHYQSQDIIHRDIKTENIMFSANGEIKLVDFGLALQTRNKVKELAGTGYYMSPGVINHKYGKECDLWAIGVTLYYLVEGHYPFEGKSKAEVFGKICKGNYPPPRHCTAECADFIAKLLNVDPSKRLTPQEGIKHKWIVSNLAAKRQKSLHRQGTIDRSIYKRLQSYSNCSIMRKTILNLYVKLLKPEDV